MNRIAAAFATVTFVITVTGAVAGCVPIARDGACLAAEACDDALDQPFNDFDADDQTFGDAGTCWANGETAKACVVECDKFVTDQLALAEASNNRGIIVACGGSLE